MKRKLSLPESSVLVYYFVKLTGLAPLTVKNDRFYPPTFLGKLYPVFVATSYLLFTSIPYAITKEQRGKENDSLITMIWGIIFPFMSLSSVVLTLIVFLLKHKKIVYLMNKLRIVSIDLKSLGIEMDHGTFFKNIFVTTVTVKAVFIATCVSIVLMEPQSYIFILIKHCIESWFNSITVLIFAQILTYIEQHFTRLNRKLHDLLIPAGYLRSTPHHSQIFVVCRKARDENQAGIERLTDLQRIRKIEALHLELCNLVDQTTDLFATPILSTSLRFAIEFMISSFSIYSTFRSSSQPCNAAIPVSSCVAHIVCSVLRMIIPAVVLFIMAYASTRTCKQGNAMKAVLFKVWIRFRPAELADEFFTFSNQLLNTTVAVSAFGFMNLDYSFIFKIFCTVVTYLIIMIQLEVPQRCM